MTANVLECRRIDIGVPEPLLVDHELPPGVRVHVLKNYDVDLDRTVIDGIPVTTVERALVDLADEWFPLEIAAAIENAAQRGLFDAAKFEETLERVDHPRGKRVARRALALWQHSLT